MRKEWTKFNTKLPDAEYLVMNSRHDVVFCLNRDFDHLCVRLHAVLLSKSTKKESKVVLLKQWDDFNFEEMGYSEEGWFPKATSMCYRRAENEVVVSIEKHLFVVAENPREKFDFYSYALGKTKCLLYDVAEHPTKRNALLAVDGAIENCKLYQVDIL